MPDSFFGLSADDRREVLTVGSDRTGRPANLLEKDIWVVWALRVLFDAPFGESLAFKGGTSLSKAYRVIDRFSEDIDLTYDIRQILPDETGQYGPFPSSVSQGRKWRDLVETRLPEVIAREIIPQIESALVSESLDATVSFDGKETVSVAYSPVSEGAGYVQPRVQLEFGARSTTEPQSVMPVGCDLQDIVPGIEFPKASPLVMSIDRTFWEKATAAHVYCLADKSEHIGHARHWYDLAAISNSTWYDEAVNNQPVAEDVANYKSAFFPAKRGDGSAIDYFDAVRGKISLVPQGRALLALRDDYDHMIESGILPASADTFDRITERCSRIEAQIRNRVAS